MSTTTNRRDALLGAVRAAAQGLTADEAEQMIGGGHQNVSARMHDLVADGLVVDSGKKRRTRTGRPATVWAAADKVAGKAPEPRLSHKRAFDRLLRICIKMLEQDVPEARRGQYARAVKALVERTGR